MLTNIRILIADDHALVRSAIARSLTAEDGITVVAEVDNASDALDKAIQLTPDIVLLDIDMPGLLSFDAARTIRTRVPNAKIMFVSAFSHDRYIQAALDVNASGYVTKGESADNVVAGIRAVARGRTYFSADVQSRIVVDSRGARLSEVSKSRHNTLTPRELEVLRYIATGMAKKEIAQTMHLSVKTVDNHSTNLMGKLDIHDRVELARYAIREGLSNA
jgi:DNA-binding NarL/FixJ family response regulator